MDKEADEKARKEADFDERTKKHNKAIGKYSIRNGKEEVLDSQEQKFWTTSAKATAYARDLTNTRGSVATPDYMEEEVRKLIKD